MSSTARKLFIAAVVSLLIATTALAQETYQLSFKSEPGQVHLYKMNAGGTLSFDLDSFPLPNSKVSGENLQAEILAEAYFDTIEASTQALKFDVRGMMDKVILGGLLQLPDMGGASAPPEAILEISPQGSIVNVEVKNLELPGMGGGLMKDMMPGGGEGMGMDFGGISDLMPVLFGLLPPIFPQDPVAVGDKWVLKIEEEDMPLPIFPIIEMRYVLESVEDGVAKIKFRTKGEYNADFINNFLSMIPEIPMGDDEMTIDNVDLLLTWQLTGIMDFDPEEGLMKNMKSTGKVELDGGGTLTFTHPDGTTDTWEPKIGGLMDMEMGIEYVSQVTREDYEALFPPPAEDEEQAEEGTPGEENMQDEESGNVDQEETVPEDL